MDGLTDALFKVQWQKAFGLDTSVLEIFIRGTIVYLALFVLLRIFRRQAGSIGISDLLVIVVIADAAQNAMAGDYTSITDGVLLVATIIFWSIVLDWLAFRFPRLRTLIRSSPVVLVRDGKLQTQNLRREMMCEEELDGELRLQGVDSVQKVKISLLESDGRISVVQREDGEHDTQNHAPERAGGM